MYILLETGLLAGGNCGRLTPLVKVKHFSIRVLLTSFLILPNGVFFLFSLTKFMSCYIISCHVMPCHAMPYHDMSFHVMSYPWCIIGLPCIVSDMPMYGVHVCVCFLCLSNLSEKDPWKRRKWIVTRYPHTAYASVSTKYTPSISNARHHAQTHPCYTMPCHVISRHITSYHMWHHVISCHIMSCHVISCHIMSCHITLCYVMLFHIMPCHVMSFRIWWLGSINLVPPNVAWSAVQIFQ